MLITSKARYTGIRAEIHIINRCITPVAILFVVEKLVGGAGHFFLPTGHPSGILLSADRSSLRDSSSLSPVTSHQSLLQPLLHFLGTKPLKSQFVLLIISVQVIGQLAGFCLLQFINSGKSQFF
jgi:hypothetical protein